VQDALEIDFEMAVVPPRKDKKWDIRSVERLGRVYPPRLFIEMTY